MTLQILLGFILSTVIAILAWRLHALSNSGAWAAFLTGGLIFGLGGIPWAILLLTFFITSSALSRAFARRKAALSEKFSKGSTRDWAQVFANGGLGSLLALTYGLLPGQPWVWVAFAGAMAAVTADTWATELGVLSTVPPRLISNGKPVERGTSGGITRMGTLSASGGAALIGVVFTAFSYQQSAISQISSWKGFLLLWAIIIIGGLAGALFDSLLGATVQAIYHCPSCQKETERYPLHICGTVTVRVRGWRWLNNDWVNFACSLVGAAIAVGIWKVLF
jgi:uncharacterized protein (TIGR00297 family)